VRDFEAKQRGDDFLAGEHRSAQRQSANEEEAMTCDWFQSAGPPDL
jgi:hypothetical protein